MTEDELDWLLSSEAANFLRQVADWESASLPSHQINKRLRKQLSPDATRLVLQQAELRVRARRKFRNADQMYFLKQPLEQATSESIAIYKSKRFSLGKKIADLCCGIGGDAIHLADRRDLTIVDIDPTTCRMAERNIQVHQQDARSIVQSVESLAIDQYDAFHIDPDRRTQKSAGGDATRSTNAEFFSPDMEELNRLCDANPNFGIKLAPATRVSFEGCEYEFIGHDRECKQQMIWSGDLMNKVGRSVTVLNNDGSVASTFVTEVNQEFEPVSFAPNIGRFLFAPHAALAAAHLIDQYAVTNQLQRVSLQANYLTGDDKKVDAMAGCFEVLDQCKPKSADLKAMIDQHDVGELEVKKQGVDDQIFARAQKVKTSGSQKRTLFLIPDESTARAILTRRCLVEEDR